MASTGPPEARKKDHPQNRARTSQEIRRGFTYLEKLDAFEAQPRRHPAIHWGAFVLAVVSFVILVVDMAAYRQPVRMSLVWLDVALAFVFGVEFFTRSGFHWNPLRYVDMHIFDFIALVPALLLLHRGVYAEHVWVWLIFAARLMRVFDRGLGDGFFLRNFFALLEGLEEEITDRVTLRIMARIQADVEAGKFGHSVAEAMSKNKEEVLRRVRAEHPRDGLAAGLARFVGLESALERTEDRLYDSIVDVLKSPELDQVIRAGIDGIFRQLRAEVGKKKWLEHFGLPRRYEPGIDGGED
jgi:hypothetical protein